MTTLEKIRDEIEQMETLVTKFEVLDIIDKYADKEPCDDNRLYIKVYADLEPQEKAEKLYQICEEDELLEVYKELGEYCDIEPCDDVVSRQAVLEQTHNWSKDEFLRVANPFDYLRERIKSLPSVRPQEQTGHWTNKEFRKEEYVLMGKCSVCGRGRVIDGFCSYCGCRMVDPQESEDKE